MKMDVFISLIPDSYEINLFLKKLSCHFAAKYSKKSRRYWICLFNSAKLLKRVFVTLLTDERQDKKSLAQEVRQKSDISECWRPPSTLTLFATRPTVCHWATCQGSSYTKNEYSLFYQKCNAEYFFIQQFFRKKLYFQRKPQKTVLGEHLKIFQGKKASYAEN